jgi:hypothetical protein
MVFARANNQARVSKQILRINDGRDEWTCIADRGGEEANMRRRAEHACQCKMQAITAVTRVT